MSKYQEKLLNGETPSDSDWNEYLRSSHEAAPSMTPKAFDAPLSADGLNTYQTLVKAFAGQSPKRILDLACGDGHLVNYIRQEFGGSVEIVGVDMSDRELGLAKKQYGDSRTVFIHGSAADVREPDGSFDLVLSHMAFMLMTPLDAVVQEVARVLAPGGSFAGIVGGSPVSTGFLPVYQRLYLEFMKQNFPNYKPFVGGDPRTKSAEGLLSVLAAPWFKDTELRDFNVTVKGTPEEIWDFFKYMYNVTLLPEPKRKEFEALVLGAAREHTDAQGILRFDFPMRLFKARRT